MLYHGARPYEVVDSVQAHFNCSKSFGNPSSHASFAATIYFTVFLLTFHETKKVRVREHELLSGY
jgi:hypothetical protein